MQNKYALFLIDAWGVLHDGRSLYPYAHDCLVQLRARRKKVVIVSNAARRLDAMADELDSIGIETDLYSAIISSGELTWRAIKKAIENGSLQGQSGYYLGPPRSRGLLDGLHLTWVDSIDGADFILNTGPPQGNPVDSSDYDALLSQAARRNLPMICANPDLLAIRAGEVGICAGAIAQRYRQLGASFIEFHGKPHRPVYDAALALFENITTPAVLAVGDAFATDICGAAHAGFDSWLIAAGIHHGELTPLNPESIREAAQSGPLPTYASEYLAW